MPIRFRCAYCSQLMAIATRKAGTVVSCPTCAGQVVVPQPAASGAQQQPAGALFDQADFEEKLQGSVSESGASFLPTPLGNGGIDVTPVKTPSGSAARSRFAPEPAGVFISPGWLAVLAIVVLGLLGLAFFAGTMLGRG